MTNADRIRAMTDEKRIGGNRGTHRIGLLIIVLITIASLLCSVSQAATVYFADLYSYQWAAESVNAMYEYGVVSGTKQPTQTEYGLYSPERNITRAEFTAMLERLDYRKLQILENDVYLPDVDTGNWCYQHAFSAIGKGFAETDYFTGGFHPENYISREESFFLIAKFVQNVFGYEISGSGSSNRFSDWQSINTRYVSAIDALIDIGIVTGSSGKLNPKALITRAEAAVCFFRVLKLHEDKYTKVDYVTPRPVVDTGLLNNFTDEQIDVIANIVMHEVGGIQGSGVSVTVTYSDGRTESYNDGCALHRIHAQVVLNQYYSNLFPSTLHGIASQCWYGYLGNPDYYSHSNSKWQHCRQDVVNVLEQGITIPNTVYAATCDPIFCASCPGYSLYASVRWTTGWVSGAFYYYKYH